MRKSTLVTLLAIPGILVLLACGSSGASTSSSGSTGSSADVGEAPTKGPTTVPAGQTLTLTETFLGKETVVEITLTDVKVNVKGKYDTAKKGQFITAVVTAKVIEGKAFISSGDFKLVGADGTAYDSTYIDGDMLSSMELTAGNKTAGLIAFDVAVGAQTGGKIALKSFLAEGDAGYWTL